MKPIQIATEKLWAKNKYEVMARGYAYYSQIKSSFHHATLVTDYLAIYQTIDSVRKLPFSKRAMVNTLEHLWGYFKKIASPSEKEQFFYLLDRVKQFESEHFTKLPLEIEKCVNYIKQLLLTYPNQYLLNSTLLFDDLCWNEITLKRKNILINDSFYQE